MKNFIIYALVALVFLPPLILFIPVLSILVILLIPLLPYFFSLDFVHRYFSNRKTFMTMSSLLILVACVWVLIKFDGVTFALAYIGYALASRMAYKNFFNGEKGI